MMRCPICGNDNPPGGRFCNRCGSQLPEVKEEFSGHAEQPQPPSYETKLPQYPKSEEPQPQYQYPHPEEPQPQYQYPHPEEPQRQYQYPHPEEPQPPYPGPDAKHHYPRQDGQPPYPGQAGQAQQQGPYAPSAKDSQGAAAGIMEKMKALPLKKILIVGVPLLVLIIAAIIIIPMISGGSSSQIKNSIIILGDRNEVIISGNNNEKFTIAGEFDSAQGSLDGGKAALLTDMIGSSGGDLWFVTTSKVTKIATGVVAYRISDSGNTVAYLAEYGDDNKAELYLYDTSKESSIKITDEATYTGGSMKGICISPDGKTVTYISEYDSRNNEYTGYIKVGNRDVEKIGENTYAIAVSNNGTTMYYIKESSKGIESLHVKSGRNENRLISEISSYSTLWLNSDYSQAIYNHEDRANISKNGGERERVYSRSIRDILLPQGTQTKYNSTGGRISIEVIGVRSLTPLVAITSDGLVYIDNKYESNRISSSSDYPYDSVISTNGRTLLYITNNGHLASIDPTRAGADRKEVGRNVEQFAASGDTSVIYFVNGDDELYFVKGNGMPSKVSDDVDGQLAMQWNGTRAFFIVDYRRAGGELYFSNNGRARTKVSGGDDVIGVLPTATSVFYVSNGGEIYRSNGNERFTRFAEDVELRWGS